MTVYSSSKSSVLSLKYFFKSSVVLISIILSGTFLPLVYLVLTYFGSISPSSVYLISIVSLTSSISRFSPLVSVSPSFSSSLPASPSLDSPPRKLSYSSSL